MEPGAKRIAHPHDADPSSHLLASIACAAQGNGSDSTGLMCQALRYASFSARLGCGAGLGGLRRGSCHSRRAIAVAQMTGEEEKKEIIRDSIRGVPDFPKPGILFWDITTLLLQPTAFQYSLDLLTERYRERQVDAVAALESRGFVFGAPLASALKVPLVLMRKPNKLPGEKISESYDLEYGSDTIEMHSDAVQPGQKIIIVDDLIATGGTMKAAINLLKRVEAEVVEVAVIIELPDLKGRAKLGDTPLFVLIQKEGL